MEPGDQRPGARVGHTEREAATRRLVAACSEGRLSLGEFEERVEAVLAAATWDDLRTALEDLAPAPVQPAHQRQWSVSMVGGLHRRGPSRLPRHLIHASLFGNASIDLLHAELSSRETTITLVSLVGRFSVRVPSAVRSELSGFSLIGGRHLTGTRPALQDGPLVHVRSFSLIGGTTIRPSGSRWRRRFALAR
jgi:hypothetical protein